MAQASDVAREIFEALNEARSAGKAPCVIVLDATTQQALQDADLGYWSAGPGTWSLFKVPVVIGHVPGWQMQFSSETDGTN
jgi:hypothetical protein